MSCLVLFYVIANGDLTQFKQLITQANNKIPLWGDRKQQIWLPTMENYRIEWKSRWENGSRPKMYMNDIK